MEKEGEIWRKRGNYMEKEWERDGEGGGDMEKEGERDGSTWGEKRQWKGKIEKLRKRRIKRRRYEERGRKKGRLIEKEG